MIDARHLRLIITEREHVTRRRITQTWVGVEERIRAEATALTEQIAERYKANDPVPITWLYQRDRLNRLLRQVHAEVAAAVPDLHAEVTESVAWGRDLAVIEAARLARDSRFANTINRRRVQTAARLTDDGVTRRVLDQLPQAVADRVEKAFVYSVALGQHPTRLAREVMAASGYGRARAQTIARTELHRAVRDASLQEWRGMLDIVAGWIWSSSLDGRTCPVCVAMHGSEHALDEPMATHANCRCVAVPLPRDVSARRPVTPGPDQFEKWPEERQAAVVGPVRLRHIKRGDFTLTDLVQTTTHPLWGPGRTTASIRQATRHAEHRRTIRTAA